MTRLAPVHHESTRNRCGIFDGLPPLPEVPKIGRRWLEGRANVDVAMDHLDTAIEFRIRDQDAWPWIAARLDQLEMRVKARGYDQTNLLAAMGDDELWYVDGPGGKRRYQLTPDLVMTLDDVAASFFVTMQTRLSVIMAEIRHVYAAAAQDGVSKAAPRAPELLAVRGLHVWQIGNCIKHRDEWDLPSKKDAEKREAAMRVLEPLGLARPASPSLTYAQRVEHPFFALQALKPVAGAPDAAYSAYLQRVVDACVAACESAKEAIFADLAPQMPCIEAARAADQASLDAAIADGTCVDE